MKTFGEKLKQAMQKLHLNQIQVSGLTGKSKGSISQYLSDKQVPPEETQVDIALALGLAEDYFSDKNDKFSVLPTKEIRNKIIPRLDINEAAKMLGMNHNTVEKDCNREFSRGGMVSGRRKTDGCTLSMQRDLRRLKELHFKKGQADEKKRNRSNRRSGRNNRSWCDCPDRSHSGSNICLLVAGKIQHDL